MTEEIDHRYTPEIVCPYCGYTFSDSWEYDDEGQEYCEECQHIFDYYKYVEVTYVSSKLDK